jgi:TRAF3-interacting protein 1
MEMSSSSEIYYIQLPGSSFSMLEGVIRSRKSKKDRQYNGQKKKDRQYNGQKKDRQYNGQKKKDRQYNGQKKKDRQYNGQKKKDRQYNGQMKKKDNNDKQNTTRTPLENGEPSR